MPQETSINNLEWGINESRRRSLVDSILSDPE